MQTLTTYLESTRAPDENVDRSVAGSSFLLTLSPAEVCARLRAMGSTAQRVSRRAAPPVPAAGATPAVLNPLHAAHDAAAESLPAERKGEDVHVDVDVDLQPPASGRPKAALSSSSAALAVVAALPAPPTRLTHNMVLPMPSPYTLHGTVEVVLPRPARNPNAAEPGYAQYASRVAALHDRLSSMHSLQQVHHRDVHPVGVDASVSWQVTRMAVGLAARFRRNHPRRDPSSPLALDSAGHSGDLPAEPARNDSSELARQQARSRSRSRSRSQSRSRSRSRSRSTTASRRGSSDRRSVSGSSAGNVVPSSLFAFVKQSPHLEDCWLVAAINCLIGSSTSAVAATLVPVADDADAMAATPTPHFEVRLYDSQRPHYARSVPLHVPNGVPTDAGNGMIRYCSTDSPSVGAWPMLVEKAFVVLEATEEHDGDPYV